MTKEILVLVVATLLGQSTTAVAQTSPARLPKGHRHPNLALENEAIPEFSIVATDMAAPRDNQRTSPHRHYQAFTVADTQLYVLDRNSGRVRELRGVPFSWRPFSNLTWANDHTLMFDRWSSPHYAVHYEVDMSNRKLVSARTFHDE